MNLGDFLNNLAHKIDAQNNPSLVSLLSSAEVSQHEISDELAGLFDTKLMSLEGAKNNREVLNHFKPIILKAADDKFAIMAEKYGIADTLAGEKSTYNKIDLLEAELARRIAQAEAKATQAGGSRSEEVTKLNGQLGEMQRQLQALTAAKDKEIAELKANATKQQLDMLVNFDLNGKNYANAELGDTNVTIARALLDKALAEHNAVLVNENGTIKLKQADNITLDVLDASNTPLRFADFTDRLLADKHMLAVSMGDDTPQYRSQLEPHIDYTAADSGAFSAAAAASLADLS